MGDAGRVPYVGPRPFEGSDRDGFFGRDEEVRQLAGLVAARRVVLLYARSGAGKTSLLRAGLLPYLADRGKIRVLGVYRVGDAEELRRVLAAASPGGDRGGKSEDEGPSLLVLDQLEELFRRERHDEPTGLFQELRQSLDRRPRLSLLLVMREDYVARLDPYAALLPDRLRTRFRLELLSEAGALQAIRGPARRCGVEIGDEVARELVDELRKVRVQDADGRTAERLGDFVEPVQLQVVCARWWNRRDDTGGALPTVGSVDRALADYYDEQVAAVATRGSVAERGLRDWIEESLVTGQGLRGLILRGADETEGLAEAVVQALVDTHLVRVERRRGTSWLELAHDRLVDPVRRSNASWREAHLRPAQRRASLWAREGRPAGLLLGEGPELETEIAWAESEAAALTGVERDFLDASDQARRLAVHARRHRRFRWLAAAAALLLAVTLWALYEERRERRADLARGLAAQARSHLDGRLDLALLLSLEASRLGPENVEAWESLLAGLQRGAYVHTFLHGHEETVWSVAMSPAPPFLLASGGQDHRIVLWDAGESRSPVGPPLEGHAADVLALAFSPDGRRLLSSDRDRKVLVWDLTAAPPVSSSLGPIESVVTAAVFDPRGPDRLVLGDNAGRVTAWDLAQEPPRATVLGEHAGMVTSLTLKAGRLASASADSTIRVWSSEGSPQGTLTGHDDWVTSVAIDADGRVLASGGLDRTVRLWDLETLKPLQEPLQGHSDQVSSVAFHPSGELLASASANGVVRLWDVPGGEPWEEPLVGNLALTRSLAFSHDGELLAAANGTSVVVWRLRGLGERGHLAGDPELPGFLTRERGDVRSVAFSPDGTVLAAGTSGGEPRISLLDAATGEAAAAALPGHPGPAQSLGFSGDGTTLVTYGDDDEHKEIRRWVWAEGRQEEGSPVTEKLPGGISGQPQERLTKVGDYAMILEKALKPERVEACTTVRLVADAGDTPGRVWEAVRNGIERRDRGSSRPTRKLIESQTECVRSLALSRDGKILAAGIDEGGVVLLQAAKLKILRRLDAGTAPVKSVAWNGTGTVLAAGGGDGTVRLWDLSTEPPRERKLFGHTGAVQALAFHPDGRLLASAGQDRAVFLWNVATGLPLAQPLAGHTAPVGSLAWSRDGETLASGGEDGVRLWFLGLEPLRKQACRIANRELSDEEWDLYVGGSRSQRVPSCP